MLDTMTLHWLSSTDLAPADLASRSDCPASEASGAQRGLVGRRAAGELQGDSQAVQDSPDSQDSPDPHTPFPAQPLSVPGWRASADKRFRQLAKSYSYADTYAARSMSSCFTRRSADHLKPGDVVEISGTGDSARSAIWMCGGSPVNWSVGSRGVVEKVSATAYPYVTVRFPDSRVWRFHPAELRLVADVELLAETATEAVEEDHRREGG